MKRTWQRAAWAISLLTLTIGLIILSLWTKNREHRYDRPILAAARRYQVDPALIKAVIWRESSFKADARGTRQEIGLMQVREDAALEWAEAEHLTNFIHSDILDPAKNINAGTYYLGKLLKRYRNVDNPLPYALADYNAGRTHVLRWKKGEADTNAFAFLNRMDYPGTRNYALSILDRFVIYQAEFKKMLDHDRH